MSHFKIAPSILAADYANFEKELKRLEKTGVEYVHIDVMDGHFVPNISFGADVVAAMRPHSKLVFDCHLMVSNPENHIETFARAGADILTIHAEATVHLHGTLQKIRAAGMKVGVVINPGTPLVTIEPVLNLVDQVLLMTVNPGFGGQAYIPEVADKIADLVNSVKPRAWPLILKWTAGLTIRLFIQPKVRVPMSLWLAPISSKETWMPTLPN